MIGQLRRIVCSIPRFAWGWGGLALFGLSTVVSNLYQVPETYRGKVLIYVASWGAVMALYACLNVARWKSAGAVLSAALAGVLSVMAVAYGFSLPHEAFDGDARVYDPGLREFIFAMKALASIGALFVFLSFARHQLFERAVWAVLASYEAYSALQFMTCKMAWAQENPMAISACGRIFGDRAAFMEIPIYAIVLLFIAWRHIKAQSRAGAG